jgi:hypothetical protein
MVFTPGIGDVVAIITIINSIRKLTQLFGTTTADDELALLLKLLGFVELYFKELAELAKSPVASSPEVKEKMDELIAVAESLEKRVEAFHQKLIDFAKSLKPRADEQANPTLKRTLKQTMIAKVKKVNCLLQNLRHLFRKIKWPMELNDEVKTICLLLSSCNGVMEAVKDSIYR